MVPVVCPKEFMHSVRRKNRVDLCSGGRNVGAHLTLLETHIFKRQPLRKFLRPVDARRAAVYSDDLCIGPLSRIVAGKNSVSADLPLRFSSAGI
jgi:hypothetical protein